MNECQKLAVGSRIESDGYYATVCFIGSLMQRDGVKLQKGITWVGVDWDDESRGKHNGSYGGVQYFTTHHPTSGSFLRPEKCNVGVSIMTALASRYCGQTLDTELSFASLFPNNAITEVGATGSDGSVSPTKNCLSKLTAASVRGLFVCDGSSDGDITSYVGNLQELDVSLNLLTEWSEVAFIVKQMPRLKVLDVSDNRMNRPPGNISVTSDIEVLYLNRMAYDWAQVSSSAQLFSRLRELHACYNRVESVENVTCSPFTEISLVNIEGNPIASWAGLLPLGELPRLETLVANECGLTSIRFPDSSMPSHYFSSLTSLSISRNAIADWPSISELNRLHSLSSLRFVDNPLSRDASASDARHIAVAKIAHLQWCNGTAVVAIERRDAELDYLRIYCLEWISAGGSASLDGPLTEAFMLEHPRYVELARKYGPLDVSEGEQKKTSALKNNLVTVKIRSQSSNQWLTRRVPTKMTVQKLKVLVQRAFKVHDAASVQLVHVVMKQSSDDDNAQDGPLEFDDSDVYAYIQMDNDFRELSFYSLDNNAVISAEW